jgi:hypothetical protein
VGGEKWSGSCYVVKVVPASKFKVTEKTKKNKTLVWLAHSSLMIHLLTEGWL